MNSNFYQVPKDLVPIGKIVRAHGLIGQIKVFLYNNNSKSLESKVKIWLKIKDQFNFFEIENIKNIDNGRLIKFATINNRNEAELLNGKLIYLSRDIFPNLNDKQYYLNDIIGFDIVDEKNMNYGKVLDVIQLPTNNSILFNFKEKEIFIPIIDDFIELFDFENKILIIKNFEGFFIK